MAESGRSRVSTLVVAVALAWSSTAASAMELTEMSLRELSNLQLDQMAITGIHHTHDRGEWMVSYSFMAMGMKGNLDGTSERSPSEIFADGFMVAPTEMYMEMHMLHAMYGVTDSLTVGVMLPYVRKSMEHERMDGLTFTTRSRGIGDVALNALYSVYRDDEHRLLLKAGLRFPTGDIDASDNLPGMGMPGSRQRLPYPMQLGSGTWDFDLGATYLGRAESWTWGGHASGIIRTDENKYDYRLGNEYDVTGWLARRVMGWTSVSLRLKWKQWFDVEGRDESLNPNMAPTADPDLRAGERLDLLFGANLFTPQQRWQGVRVGFEAGLPVYQSLDGPQLETDWMAGVTVDFVF